MCVPNLKPPPAKYVLRKQAIEYMFFWLRLSQKRIAIELGMLAPNVSRFIMREGWGRKLIKNKYKYRKDNARRVRDSATAFTFYLKIEHPELYTAVLPIYEAIPSANNLVMYFLKRQTELYEQLETAKKQYLNNF